MNLQVSGVQLPSPSLWYSQHGSSPRLQRLAAECCFHCPVHAHRRSSLLTCAVCWRQYHIPQCQQPGADLRFKHWCQHCQAVCSPGWLTLPVHGIYKMDCQACSRFCTLVTSCTCKVLSCCCKLLLLQAKGQVMTCNEPTQCKCLSMPELTDPLHENRLWHAVLA